MNKEAENRLKHFAALKSKYQATNYQDSSPSSLLYLILRKVDLGIEVTELELNWLRQQELFATIEIIEIQQFSMGEAKRLEAEFSHLKTKYKIAKFWEYSVNSFLYSILWKLEYKNDLSDSEIEWLGNHGYEDIIKLAQQKHFTILKRKYGLVDNRIEPFYKIMLKLEKRERLDPKLVLQLMEEDILSTGGKIALTYYRLEAEFYDQEIKRTGNKWHIPTASSYWRKANQPDQAIIITNLDLGKIKDNKLKS